MVKRIPKDDQKFCLRMMKEVLYLDLYPDLYLEQSIQRGNLVRGHD